MSLALRVSKPHLLRPTSPCSTTGRVDLVPSQPDIATGSDVPAPPRLRSCAQEQAAAARQQRQDQDAGKVEKNAKYGHSLSAQLQGIQHHRRAIAA